MLGNLIRALLRSHKKAHSRFGSSSADLARARYLPSPSITFVDQTFSQQGHHQAQVRSRGLLCKNMHYEVRYAFTLYHRMQTILDESRKSRSLLGSCNRALSCSSSTTRCLSDPIEARWQLEELERVAKGKIILLVLGLLLATLCCLIFGVMLTTIRRRHVAERACQAFWRDWRANFFQILGMNILWYPLFLISFSSFRRSQQGCVVVLLQPNPSDFWFWKSKRDLGQRHRGGARAVECAGERRTLISRRSTRHWRGLAVHDRDCKQNLLIVCYVTWFVRCSAGAALWAIALVFERKRLFCVLLRLICFVFLTDRRVGFCVSDVILYYYYLFHCICFFCD